MRILFLLMVLANIALFAWGWFLHPGSDLRRIAPQPPPGTLQLLGQAASSSAGRVDCFELAGLVDREQAARLTSDLRARGLAVHAVNGQKMEPLGYWVYLPPADSLEDAQVLARRLSDQGVDDYVFVVGRQKANAISLGVYPTRTEAVRRQREITSLGYEPVVEQRFIPRDAVNLEVKGASSQLPPAPDSSKWTHANCQVQGF